MNSFSISVRDKPQWALRLKWNSILSLIKFCTQKSGLYLSFSIAERKEKMPGTFAAIIFMAFLTLAGIVQAEVVHRAPIGGYSGRMPTPENCILRPPEFETLCDVRQKSTPSSNSITMLDSVDNIGLAGDVGRYSNSRNVLYQTGEAVGKAACTEPLTQRSLHHIEYVAKPDGFIPDVVIYCQEPLFGDLSYQGVYWFGIVPWSITCPSYNQIYPQGTHLNCDMAPEKEPPCKCKFGNPVNFASREKTEIETDYRTTQGLEFFRYYSNKATRPGREGMTTAWRHSYSKKLVSTKIQRNPDIPHIPIDFYTWRFGSWIPYGEAMDGALLSMSHDTALILRPDGYGYYFVSADNGMTWRADSDVNARLSASQVNASGSVIEWKLITPQDDVEIYDQEGRLTAIHFRSGRIQAMIYSDATTPATIASMPGLLTEVSDNFGKKLHFQYDARSRLVKMTAPGGQDFVYSYDSGNNNLLDVTYPDGLKKLYHYNEPAYQPNQANPDFLHFLTGISEELAPGNVVRYGIYRYDAGGNPVSTEHANGVDKFSFDYSNNSVTNPSGAVANYGFSRLNGVLVLVASSLPAGSGSSRTWDDTTYDGNSNVARHIDFNGVQTTYNYDLARNLEINRIEAFGTPSARTISTTWHPTYRLPLTINEPGRISHFLYDSTGNLLSKTIDANGVTRTWSYTYNAVGQVLTATGPRTDVPDVTTYTYDTQGNLSSVTNPLGQTTTLTNYDANGWAGYIVDANGLTTFLTYSPRGWLTSRHVSGVGVDERTTYAYDGVGQLTTVTLPDMLTVTYTYDAAHRLTNITDSQGNSIAYTLDAMGNRISEQVKDPGGTLARQTTRVYDALNRLQKITGGQQ